MKSDHSNTFFHWLFSANPQPRETWKRSLHSQLKTRFQQKHGIRTRFWEVFSLFSQRSFFMAGASFALLLAVAGTAINYRVVSTKNSILVQSTNELNETVETLLTEQESSFVALDEMLTELENL